MCSGIALIGRIVIGILSIVFAIAGVGILIVGILVKVNSPVVNSLLDTALAAVKEHSKSLTGTAVDTDKFDINELVGGLAIVFIVIGCVFLFLGILGVAGACCTVRCMLQLYMLIIVIFLVAQVVFVVVLAGDRKLVTEPPKDTLKQVFHTEYAGLEGQDTISLLWNVIMDGLQCCGIDGVSDIKTAPKWLASSEGAFVGPAACCKTGQFTGPTSVCVITPIDAIANTNTPCYEKVLDFAFQGTWFIIVALSSLGFHTLLAVFSYAILKETGNKNSVGAA